ncbi:hypothetical protein SAMN05444414_1388 [Roseovarius marisflavi]|uniref:Uncharacterized protein n=1 Tax=Roseovarius marisflavi TaxID=1054996 RepID=A0A1M7DBD1_9RHOB|nr:hypothetical protein SAMN05444414_1388 [Roseovarius marisflavi]
MTPCTCLAKSEIVSEARFLSVFITNRFPHKWLRLRPGIEVQPLLTFRADVALTKVKPIIGGNRKRPDPCRGLIDFAQETN